MCSALHREHHRILSKPLLLLKRVINARAIMSEIPFDEVEESQPEHKCVFYDMKHSNNAARIRLWLRIKNMDRCIETKLLTHDDLESDDYANINPLKKVPALETDNGRSLFEASVIMQYLEDRFGSFGPPCLIMESAEDRALVNLIVKCHDLYIASPNCTQPNFSHTQGCLYLDPYPTEFTPAARTMRVEIRAAKVAEIYKQLTWLEEQIRLPYMAGDSLTHADLTWLPTVTFMELLLPEVFDWSSIFHDETIFPKLTAWFQTCCENEHFSKTRQEIRETLLEQKSRGRFAPVREEVQKHPEFKWKYM